MQQVSQSKITALNNMTLCKIKSKTFSEVVALSNQVLLLDPQNVKARYYLALYFEDCRLLQQSLSLMQEIYSEHPENAEIHQKMAEIQN